MNSEINELGRRGQWEFTEICIYYPHIFLHYHSIIIIKYSNYALRLVKAVIFVLCLAKVSHNPVRPAEFKYYGEGLSSC